MSRFAMCGFAMLVLALGSVSAAAPVPKEGKGDEVPNLKEFFTTVGKAVKVEKWPAEAEEKKLLDTTQAIFDRTLKAAELKARRLPVAAGQLKKVGPLSQPYKANVLIDTFLIGSDVEINGAQGCVIFATGEVRINGASDCVIVGKSVRCTSTDQCFVVADGLVRVVGTTSRKGAENSVLVAGKWIRVTGAYGPVCHVINPGNDADPEYKVTDPISATTADGAIFLNEEKHCKTVTNMNTKTIVPKTPIVK